MNEESTRPLGRAARCRTALSALAAAALTGLLPTLFAEGSTEVQGRLQAGQNLHSSGGGYAVSGAIKFEGVNGRPFAMGAGDYALAGGLSIAPTAGATEFDPQPEPPGLPLAIQEWSGEGNANSGVNGPAGVLAQGVAFAPGLRGLAFEFDGTGSRLAPPLTFGNQAGNFGSGDFTISLHVRATVGRLSVILSKRGFCSHANFWEISMNGRGVPYAEIDEDAAGKNYTVLSGREPMADGAWHHLALVRRGTVFELYQDGRLASQKTTVGIVPFANDALLRASVGACSGVPGQGAEVYSFAGAIDELQLFDRAFSAQQIAALAGFGYAPTVVTRPAGERFNYPAREFPMRVEALSLAHEFAPYQYQWNRNGVPIPGATSSQYTVHPVVAETAGDYTVTVRNRYGSTTSQPTRVELLSNNPLAPGPDHWWSGDGHAQDGVGGAHGTLAGNARFGPGRFGQAFSFPGGDADRNGSVLFGKNVGNFETRDFTVEYWIRTTNAQLMTVFGKRFGCNHGNFWESFVRGRPFVEVDEDPQGKNYLTIASPTDTPITDGQWHHIALVREGVEFRHYRDGRLSGTATSSGVLPFHSDAELRAGVGACTDGGRFGRNVWPFAGELDEIKIYRSALTPRQIAAAAQARTVPALLEPRNVTRLISEPTQARGRFQWSIEPPEGSGLAFTEGDLEEVMLETSVDMRVWQVVPGALRLVAGKVEVADPALFQKRLSFYRIVFRDPALHRVVGGGVSGEQMPAQVRSVAQAHIDAFLGLPEARTEEEALWADVELDPAGRALFHPAHEGGIVPCFFELKLVNRADRAARGYIMVSVAEDPPVVVEFGTEGITKTERALREIPGVNPYRFMRFTPGFIAMEDPSGNLLGTLGTWPGLPTGAPPSEVEEYSGEYDSENRLRTRLPGLTRSRTEPPGYPELRASFASNPVRTTLRNLRRATAVSRTEALGASRRRLTLVEGTSGAFQTGRIFAAVRVDADLEDGRAPEGESVVAEATLLRGGGFRVQALRPGTELVRVRTREGQVETYVIAVTPKAPGAVVASGGLQAQGCPAVEASYWKAGTGWHHDQRQYHQPRSSLWCPAVGCGPAALAMWFGWWEQKGVPSAFYKLKLGFGDKDDFRFDLNSLRTVDAAKEVSEGETIGEIYVLSTEEKVMHDLHNLCNTFCVSGQGATYPDQLISGAVEYLERAANNIGAPQNEFGERFISALLSYSYTDGYWAGMTDWRGGGVKVANGIKVGRPGIVGLGDIVWDLHYALAYAYKRVDYYEGCGSNRERVDRRRWFKCNMGWGSGAPPEWHDAESVWFGMSGSITQKYVP